MWANYQLVNPDSDNFTHTVSVASSSVFWMDLKDQVRWSALGLRLVSPLHLTYTKDLTEYSQGVVSQFMSAFRQAKNPEATATVETTVAAGPTGTSTHAEDVIMESNSPGKTKATDKCRVKPSTQEQSVPVNNSHEKASIPASGLEMKAGPVVTHRPEETEVTTSVAMVTSRDDASNEPLVDTQTLNQAREMVFHQLKQSKIVNECRVWVAHTISTVVSKCTTQLFQPFTSYISDVSDEVKTWRRKVMVICLEMAHCNYETYCACFTNV